MNELANWGPYQQAKMTIINTKAKSIWTDSDKVINWISYLLHLIINRFPRTLKWKIIRLKPVLCAQKGRSPKLTKQVLILRFLFKYSLKIVFNVMLYTFFSVWLRTGPNPEDINWFQTGIRNGKRRKILFQA